MKSFPTVTPQVIRGMISSCPAAHPLLVSAVRPHTDRELLAGWAFFEAAVRVGMPIFVWIDVLGRIVDGRVALAFCKMHGIKPEYVSVADDDIATTIRNNNLGRNLNGDEVLRSLITLSPESVRQLLGASSKGVPTRDLIARQTGCYSPRTVSDAKAAFLKSPETFALLGTDLNLREMKRIAELTSDQQTEVRHLVLNEGVDPTAAWAQIRNASAASNKKSVAEMDGTFSIVMADPPWSFKNGGAGLRASAAGKYETQTIEWIKDLGRLLEPKLAKDAMLCLWTPDAKLEEALEVMKAWGFQRRPGLVWIKRHLGVGLRGPRACHEYLLLGYRGEELPRRSASVKSWFSSRVKREHSRKPPEAYAAIERLYGDHRRLDLFQRGEGFPGWEPWGNQVTRACQPPEGLETWHAPYAEDEDQAA